MKNYDEVLKHITPQIKKADKLLRALEKRKFFNASGFTILSIPEYTVLVALLVDADMVMALLFPPDQFPALFGEEPQLPHDEWGRPIEKKDIH
mgnify:CR=1 FL=1